MSGLILVITYPKTGLNMMEMKNDHSTPIFFFFPRFSEMTNASTYQRTKINMTRYSFIRSIKVNKQVNQRNSKSQQCKPCPSFGDSFSTPGNKNTCDAQ